MLNVEAAEIKSNQSDSLYDTLTAVHSQEEPSQVVNNLNVAPLPPPPPPPPLSQTEGLQYMEDFFSILLKFSICVP